MHYGKRDFAKWPWQTTIKTKHGESIGQRQHLSSLDVKQMNLYYKCNEKIWIFCITRVLLWSHIWDISYIELRIWNQVSYDHYSYERNWLICVHNCNDHILLDVYYCEEMIAKVLLNVQIVIFLINFF